MYDASQKIRLLEPIVMFLAYSRYRLCEESIEKFDPKICNQHLQECLTGVLCCYDELEDLESHKEPTIRELERRCFIECLYQVFNLGSPESFARSLTLPDYVRQNATFKLCFQICLAFQQGNLYRVLMGFPQLPHVLCALAAIKLQAIRRSLLQIFTHAYSNKQLSVPVPYLLRLLLIDSTSGLQDQCRHYNIAFTDDRKAVHFSKADFNHNTDLLKPKHERFVESKLKRIYLPEVLLLKKFY
ncbi:SAC3 domain-containing protein 1 isoform X2 [Drosophila ficusphila]|nr:SAC3 domain-containing protein 1 isoform X2 [Drosophila ficusphila]